MPAPVRLLPSLVLGWILAVGPGNARAYDPALVWQTLRTEHFQLHFHDGCRELAQEVAGVAEEALGRVAAVLEHLPAEPIQLVISDDADSANGLAQVLPYNIVHLLASAPDDLSVLNDYDDYLQLLLLHELSHIVHMDTVLGLPAWINRVLGRTVFPNGAQPPWIVEGIAVRNESALSSAGRIRSSLFRMMLRTAALAGAFPTLDEVTGSRRAWPQGTASYLFGGFFFDYLARRFGEPTLTDLSHDMAGRLIPWTLNIVARRVFGDDYPTLWRDFSAAVAAEAREIMVRLEGEGLTPYRRLTRQAQYQLAPRLSPGSGQVLYTSLSRDRWPELRLISVDGSLDRALGEINGEGGAAFTPDGRRVVFSQPEVFQRYYYFSDLYLKDLESGTTRRLSHGLRAVTPDVAPDGQAVVFVQNRLGRTRLGLLPLAGGAPRWLTEPGEAQVFTPRFSPDGRAVVFSRSTPGRSGRNLWLLNLQDGLRRALTEGQAMDLGPVFSPRGDAVYFSSDRSGIYNLHVLSLATGKSTRLTNLATGAFSPDPAPDGSGLVFVVYGPNGYDIAWLDLPARELPVLEVREARPDPPYQVHRREIPAEPYRPWWTLLPRSWFPLYGSDAYGATYGLLVGGQDVLGKISYLLGLSYGPSSREVSFDLSLRASLVYPDLTLYGARHSAQDYREAYVNDEVFPVTRVEYTLFAEIDFPFPTVRQYHVLFLNYDLRLFDRRTAVPRDPQDRSPWLPDDRPRAWLGIGWYGSSARSFLDSISTEEGWSASLSARFSHSSLGSGPTLGEGRFTLRAYWPTWRAQHHVLAFGLQGAAAAGDTRHRPVYSIGGLPIRDPLLDSYYGYRYSDVTLRGYDPGAFAGWTYLLGSLEYRLPIVTIERGLWSLPVFVNRLYGAVFIDAGMVALRVTDLLDDPKVGLGGELRLDLLLGYYLPFTLRFGYGRGLTADGVNNLYLTMGSGF